MSKKRRFLGKSSGDDDPLAGMANLTDAMLVLAVGFLIFAVMSMNMQSIIFNDATPEEKKENGKYHKRSSICRRGRKL
nr:DUF2149 domain-containing protein [Methanobrevibacter arboriphilus]